MSPIEPSISNFRLVNNHPYLRALADVHLSGFVIRGIKLEENSTGQLFLGFPGRKVQGHWQLVCESDDARSHRALLERMTQEYAHRGAAA